MSDAPRRLFILFVVFAVTAGGLLAIRGKDGYGLFDLLRGRPAPKDRLERHKPESFTLREGSVLTGEDVPGLAQLSLESVQVAERVLPSVVSIYTATKVRNEQGQTRTLRRQGAGVIVTPEGHVVTAAHVVRNFEDIVVKLSDDREMKVERIRAHAQIDIAVLKIIARDKDESFRALSFIEDSETVRQGEFVFTFGNPYGLRRSGDFGIISSKERGYSDGSTDLFQISSRMLPGHSGGPLVNVFGEIIGVNSAIFGRDATETSVGMAIVSNDVRDFLQAALRRGKTLYGHLGVHVQRPAIYRHLSAFDDTLQEPVEVDSVTPGSAAEKAGLRGGDVITHFGGKPVKNFVTFKRLMRERLAGEKVSIAIRRGEEEKMLIATMAELDLRKLFARSEGWTEKRAVDYIRRSLGAEVSNLSAAQKRMLGLRAAAGGVVVTDVLPRMPAHGQLKTGDVIEICNGFTFQNAEQLVALIDQRPQEEIDLMIIRPQGRRGRSSLMLGLAPLDVDWEEGDGDDDRAPAQGGGS